MHDAKSLAVKIHDRLGDEIGRACVGTLIRSSFLAGLISVENAQLNPHAYRFEKKVFAKLKRLRNPLVFWRKEWSGITQADLQGESDFALINLATSLGYVQIMGWWSIRLTKLLGRPITVEDTRDPKQHLDFAVKLLNLTAHRYLKTCAYGDVLRIWNTGSPTGRTHDPEYVAHALAVDQEYRKLTTTHDAPTPQHPRPERRQTHDS